LLPVGARGMAVVLLPASADEDAIQIVTGGLIISGSLASVEIPAETAGPSQGAA